MENPECPACQDVLDSLVHPPRFALRLPNHHANSVHPELLDLPDHLAFLEAKVNLATLVTLVATHNQVSVDLPEALVTPAIVDHPDPTETQVPQVSPSSLFPEMPALKEILVPVDHLDVLERTAMMVTTDNKEIPEPTDLQETMDKTDLKDLPDQLVVTDLPVRKVSVPNIVPLMAVFSLKMVLGDKQLNGKLTQF